MELLIIILFIISLAINILLILRGISLVSEIEQSQTEYYELNEYTLDRLESMLNEMRAIDLKGSFESDDEVGVVFTELKDIIEKYKNTL
jgi:hypothetical protein|tara:strand:- start:149 stop:415 length:267 start_codon:yes stop_codon:yes gene_type:complete